MLWNEPAATDGDFDRGCGLEILEPVGGVSEARHDDDLVGHRVSADDLQQRLVLPAGLPPAMRQAQEAAIQPASRRASRRGAWVSGVGIVLPIRTER